MIGFLQPWVLAALPLAALPLILHLLARREPPTVAFPAVRYLVDATREHQRRLRLRHLLLLAVRTLLALALILAAAGPTLPAGGPGSHAPAALVVVLDNSLSSGVTAGGTPVLEPLRAAARIALGRATAADGLWLLTADGVVRRGDPGALGAILDTLGPSAARLDLGTALTLAGEVLAGDARPGEILLLTDLQASALSAAAIAVPLRVGRPEGEPPTNVGLSGLALGPQPWTQSGGRVTLSAAGAGASTPVMLELAGRAHQALVAPDAPVDLAVPAPRPGWWPVRAELAPDELRGDNVRQGAVRVLPPAAVRWDPADRWVATAFAALAAGGRVRSGAEVVVGRLGPGPSVVVPPEDAAEVGALNRNLERRGVAWRYGPPSTMGTEVDSGEAAGSRVLRRHALEPAGSGRTGVLVTAGGQPWAVRTGSVVLLGSRLEPEWTDLPLRGGFVPFLDAMVNRTVRGESFHAEGAPGSPVLLPDRVSEVRRGERAWQVEGGARFVAPDAGIYALLSGSDTVGVVAMNPDPRESALERAADRDAHALWRGAELEEPARAAGRAFTGSARADLRGPLLWLAALLALAELLLTTHRKPEAPDRRANQPSSHPAIQR